MDLKQSEETLKVEVFNEYFSKYKYETLGKIDFAIYADFPNIKPYLLWAEAKKGNNRDIHESFVQLILTIGKEKTYSKCMPPKYIGALDAEKIAFIEYSDILHIFSQNDFDWNVAPSDHSTKEFKQLFDTVRDTLEENKYLFAYETDDKELREFIIENFAIGSDGTSKMQVDKNNFVHVFNQWLREVKPTIQVNWARLKKKGILEADFFLADLMSEDNYTLYDNLYVVLRHRHYELDRLIDEDGLFVTKKAEFTDGQKAHTAFWNKYERPPEERFRPYILERRDLLVPDDMREKKGAFYTPDIWVAKSQEYLAKTLGIDWQENYYVWDCCAGTGNLLVGLSNKRNIFASTLDKADVEVMRQNLVERDALFDNHIFQFDFLNDSFDDPKVPERLRKIINDPEERKKLVIYINPPYAEADSRVGRGRSGVAVSRMHTLYDKKMGYAKREVFIQFFTRIYEEIHGCVLAQFSTLKLLQAPAFKTYRRYFKAKLRKAFLIPADTFDNVNGQFPIGFFVWDTNIEERFTKIKADYFDRNNRKIGKKLIISYDGKRLINEWAQYFIEDDKLTQGASENDSIGNITAVANDFQHNRTVCIERAWKPWNHQYRWQVSKNNLIQTAIYFSVRLSTRANWLNDRDQFLYPKKGWEKDAVFQGDCLAFILFNGQNRITSTQGTNHWIPFTEEKLGLRSSFDSHFMSDFIAGRIKPEKRSDLFNGANADASHAYPTLSTPIKFSAKARAVMEAGRELWKYYHKQQGASLNASYYDIRAHFQGTNEGGKMNANSDDGEYNRLHDILKERMRELAEEIEAKAYEYEFLVR